jgi:hypothetical protein
MHTHTYMGAEEAMVLGEVGVIYMYHNNRHNHTD